MTSICCTGSSLVSEHRGWSGPASLAGKHLFLNCPPSVPLLSPLRQGLWIRGLARPAEAFDMEDLDHYDLILVLDRGLHAEILAQVAEAVPLDSELYLEKVGSRGNEGSSR